MILNAHGVERDGSALVLLAAAMTWAMRSWKYWKVVKRWNLCE